MDSPPNVDITLILLGHGSTVNGASAAPVFQHCALLKKQGKFADVKPAFWKQEPQILEVIGSTNTSRIITVPFFISAGFFSDKTIPESLGYGPTDPASGCRSIRQPGHVLVYTQPIGTHDKMTEVLLSRARGVVAEFPFPRPPRPDDISLFIAGHGTDQNENSRQSIERQVELISARHIYADVHAIFLDESPRIPECYEIATKRNLVVVPFFVSDGMHVQEDIPVLLGEPERLVKQRLAQNRPPWRNPNEKKGKLVWYAQAVGSDPLAAEVALERAEEAMRFLSTISGVQV